MIFGLTGKTGSGKSVVAEYFQDKGYEFYSLSDMIREEIRSKGLEVTRENLIATGRRLREEGGPSALADRVRQKFQENHNYIIDSIRNPAEVKSLQQAPEFKLIYVDADQKVRFERVVSRKREGDPLDFDKFVELENKELQSDNPAAQQLNQTIALADVTVHNNGTIEELIEQLDHILKT